MKIVWMKENLESWIIYEWMGNSTVIKFEIRLGRFWLVEPVARMKAPCGNRLDFEHYLLGQKCFSFTFQAYFHNLYVFIEIYKIMFYLVSKHFRHCVGSTKVLGCKLLTVGQVFCLQCNCNPYSPRLSTTPFNDGLENETWRCLVLCRQQ